MSGVLDRRVTDAFAANGKDLLAYLERRVTARADAADVLGETMVTVWRKARHLPVGTEDARRWLFVVARNTLLNHERGRRRRVLATERMHALIASVEIPRIGAELAVDVRNAVATLSPDIAELVRLIHWEQFTIADAAAILGISASTARGQYMRAKATLQELLGERVS